MYKKSSTLFFIAGIAVLLVAISLAVQPGHVKAVAADPTPTIQVPFLDDWTKSPHNDTKAMAFNDWNETADKMVPADCAKCHSTTGYQDFVGADKSAAGKTDKPAPIGQTIQCVACHNTATLAMSSVTFLSTTKDAAGKETPITISGLGPEARCMVCHQGRATKTQVDARIAQFKAADKLDEVPAPIKDAAGKETKFGFLNIHYFAAAITLYGSEVHGGYEYDGKAYDAKFDHVTGIDTCVACHNPHTVEVRVEVCKECHTGVTKADDLKKVREPSSVMDYDGDGNVKEGMAEEIAGMQANLMKGIQAYAKDVAKLGVVYDPAAYPYWFADQDGNGKPDQNDKKANISFTNWTPRLLKAAYNYQVSVKDPGAFAHGNKYIVQLLYDSLEDINSALATKVDMSKMHRDDAGHFAGNTEPFRHWDAEGKVPSGCAKCHSAAGLPQFVKEGVVTSQDTSNGFQCATCHNTAEFPKVMAVKDVPFPSGARVTFGDGVPANMCLECHQGRESTVSVNKAVAGLDADKPSDKLGFRNVHYFAAGATLFGTDVKGMYEYKDQTYVGQFLHDKKNNKCTDCHDKHALAPDVKKCVACHKTDDPMAIRMASKDDFNGNGDAKEGLGMELKGYQDVLYKAIQSYAKDVAGTGIVYSATAYPYFFVDKDGDGKPDKNDKGANIGYNAWTPRLLEAAYNYQYSIKDPGAYVHNAKYVMQTMYDSINDLNSVLKTKIDISKMVRPK